MKKVIISNNLSVSLQFQHRAKFLNHFAVKIQENDYQVTQCTTIRLTSTIMWFQELFIKCLKHTGWVPVHHVHRITVYINLKTFLSPMWELKTQILLEGTRMDSRSVKWLSLVEISTISQTAVWDILQHMDPQTHIQTVTPVGDTSEGNAKKWSLKACKQN